MRVRRLLPVFPVLALVACSPGVPVGQFGPYQEPPLHLVLPAGDTLVVYRVKTWVFGNGNAPAVQLEYEPPFSVADTAAVRREAIRVWPAFVPYVEATGVTSAIVTATNFHRRGIWWFSATTQRHFGVLAARDAEGVWRLVSDGTPLPPAEPGPAWRIIDRNGEHLPASSMIVPPVSR